MCIRDRCDLWIYLLSDIFQIYHLRCKQRGIQPSEIKDLPVFLTHGSEDKGIDFSLAEKTNSFLKNKSVDVKMTVEKSGHTISDKQFQDFIDWSKTIE